MLTLLLLYILQVFLGWGVSPPPRSGHTAAAEASCLGWMSSISLAHYFSTTGIQSLHHECFPKTPGLWKLDRSSLCKSRDAATHSFIFKGTCS